MSKLTQLARDLGELCESKRRAYGDSVGKSAEVLRILYPNGLKPDQYLDAITAARIVDKLSRKAQGNDPHGESPYIDAAGHALVALAHHSVEVPETPCASANGSAAETLSPAPSDSAANDAPAPTTPTASVPSGKPLLAPFSKPSSSASASTAASARTATANASTDADVRREAADRNRLGLCARTVCPTELNPPRVYQVMLRGLENAMHPVHCCSFTCAAILGGW